MNRLLIILVLMLTSILTTAQEIPNFELEYYSLEEIQKFINQEIAYMSNPDYRHGGYWCNVPLEIACQIFPFLRHEFEPLPPSKTPDIENLVPFHSLVDLEKVQTHLEPYVLKTTTLGFLNNGQGPVDKAYMEQKVQSSDFETWNDYILDQAQEEFKRNLYTVLVDYGDGFLMPDIYYNNSWSNLKNSFSSIEYDSYPREMYPRYYLDEPNLGITKEKAETLLGSCKD